MVRVMASGVFDILHMGHVHYLTEARALGDELWVVVACDDTVRKLKHDPITPEKMRAELVGSLKPVAHAIIGKSGGRYEVVKQIAPDIIALGHDQPPDDDILQKELEENGIVAKVVRIGQLHDDLNGTRKILRKVIDWYTYQNRMKEVEGD